MRQLNKTVLAGGVVYPAGSPATPELEAAVTNPKHWTGDPEPSAGDDGGEPVDYATWKKADLEAEVDQRNADRDPDGQTYIHVEEPKNKAEYAAALAADDQADDSRGDGD